MDNWMGSTFKSGVELIHSVASVSCVQHPDSHVYVCYIHLVIIAALFPYR